MNKTLRRVILALNLVRFNVYIYICQAELVLIFIRVVFAKQCILSTSDARHTVTFPSALDSGQQQYTSATLTAITAGIIVGISMLLRAV